MIHSIKLISILCLASFFMPFAKGNNLQGSWRNTKDAVVTAFTITPQGEIQVFGKCSPKSCNWGVRKLGRVQPIQGSPYQVAKYQASSLTRTLKIYRITPNKLSVKLNITYKNNRPAKNYEFTFLRRSSSVANKTEEAQQPSRPAKTRRITAFLPQIGTVKNLEVVEQDGDYVFQGDIILTDRNINPAKYLNEGDDLRTVQQGLAGKLSWYDSWKWESGIIPFEFHPSIRNHTVLKNRVLEAIDWINTQTVLRIVERNGQEDYIRFIFKPNTCSSCIGRQGGEQSIKINMDCKTGNIAHEILHAAGFYHEHVRNDRDDYVRINWDNIDPDKESNFEVPFAIEAYTPYDYYSIMHYGETFFSVNGEKTIVPLVSGVKIGNRNALSTLDIRGINRVYSKDRWYLSESATTPWKAINVSKVDMNKLAVGDFTGNRKADVFYANQGRWQLSNDGKGAWRRINNSGIERPSLGFGDFNGDKKMDIFYANGSKWQVSYGGTSAWTYLNKSNIKVGALRFGDFNGDGKTDVFYANGKEWKVSYGGKSGWRTINRSGIRVNKLLFGDFNGDRKTDVLYPNGQVWRISYGGTAQWQTLNRSAITKEKLAIGDFNGDGKSDVFYPNGKVWKISYGGNTGWRVVAISKITKDKLFFGDFNGDRKTDVFSPR